MHKILVGNIAVGKHHGINLVFGDQLFHIFFFEDGNAFGIQPSGEFRRISSAGNVGNLSGSECDNLVVGIIPKDDIKIMKVPACSTKNQDSLHSYPSGGDRLT